jgi:hypothetical protein
VPLTTLVAVTGRRWTIEESFQAGKGLTGLDEHQVRCCTGHDGDAVTKPEPATATTAVKQSNSPDHELRLE